LSDNFYRPNAKVASQHKDAFAKVKRVRQEVPDFPDCGVQTAYPVIWALKDLTDLKVKKVTEVIAEVSETRVNVEMSGALINLS
jgi:hypothetical protein